MTKFLDLILGIKQFNSNLINIKLMGSDSLGLSQKLHIIKDSKSHQIVSV